METGNSLGNGLFPNHMSNKNEIILKRALPPCKLQKVHTYLRASTQHTQLLPNADLDEIL